uniref:Uncharacterized protein n=1 Tax=Lepeophtheirus salmonis TaxID=72036 RepID=A0A0K2TK34_LEPSM
MMWQQVYKTSKLADGKSGLFSMPRIIAFNQVLCELHTKQCMVIR